ncbi:MAG: hypothetical protein JW751_17005 [Polyangiaceae bacterium]|nr:hypothetical protein [Polyangiaceae bacterium]
MSSIAVFLNPNARKNSQLPPGHHRELALSMGGDGTVYLTPSLDELRSALRTSLSGGARYFVADGGDGSLSCVLHELQVALTELGRSPDELPPITPTASGTIGFVARRVGIRSGTARLLRRLASIVREGREPPTQTIPSLRVTGAAEAAEPEGERPFERLGFALAAGGIGQRFFDKYYREVPGRTAIVKVVGKAITSYSLARGGVMALLPESLRGYGEDLFRPTRARVTIDGRVVPTELHGAIHAGAFRVSLGGIFQVFPLANAGGPIHFQAGGISAPEIIAALPSLVRGKRIRSAELVEVAGTEMYVESLGEHRLRPILDGEALERVIRLRVRPGPAIPILDLSPKTR